MRGAWLLVLLLAGCVDPAARIEHDLPPDVPPVTLAPIRIQPEFLLEDAAGRWTTTVWLGESIFVNATGTPTSNLSSMDLMWIEQREMAESARLWPASPFERFAYTPRSEGTHELVVETVSETGHQVQTAVHVGVLVREEHAFDVAADPLGPPQACHEGQTLLGEPTSASAPFWIVQADLPREQVVLRATAAPSVLLAWCYQDGPLPMHHGEGWTAVATPVDDPLDGIWLWVARTGNDPAHVTVERLYPGTPRH